MLEALQLRMQIEPYSGNVEQDLMDLLLLADPSPEMINTYLSSSELFVASEGSEKIGIAVLFCSGGEYELKSIAVLPAHQRKGVAKQLRQSGPQMLC